MLETCPSCGNTILFGGARDGGRVFCSQNCLATGKVLSAADTVSPLAIEKEARRIWMGSCPCQGPGPVDVHTSHRIMSALVVSYHQTIPVLCCVRCARSAQGRDLAICLAAGWWSLHGIILTPIKVCQNLYAMFSRHDAMEPSAAVREIARLQLGGEKLRKMESGAEDADAARTSPFRRKSASTAPAGARMPANSTLAVAGMVLGILSIVLALCFPLGIAAVVSSIMALRRIEQGTLHQDDKRWATTGLVTGIVGLLISAAIFILPALLKK